MLESRNNTFKSGIDLNSYLSGGASYSSALGLEVRRHERPQNRSKTMKKHENHEKTLFSELKSTFLNSFHLVLVEDIKMFEDCLIEIMEKLRKREFVLPSSKDMGSQKISNT